MKKILDITAALVALSLAVSCGDRNGDKPLDPQNPETEQLTQRQILKALSASGNTVHKCLKVDDTHYRITMWDLEPVKELVGSREFPDGVVRELVVNTKDTDLASFSRVGQGDIYGQLYGLAVMQFYYKNLGGNRLTDYLFEFRYHPVLDVKLTSPDLPDYGWKMTKENTGYPSIGFPLRKEGKTNDREHVKVGETFHVNYEIVDCNFEPEDVNLYPNSIFKEHFDCEILNRNGAKGTLKITLKKATYSPSFDTYYRTCPYVFENSMIRLEIDL